jgi:hypothetical protein
MDYFFANFRSNIVAALGVTVATLVVTVFAAVNARRRGRSMLTACLRVLAVGAAAAAVTATTLNGAGSGGSLRWGIGEGGLDDWRTDLARFPDTIQSVLLVGNVLLYVPVGFLSVVAWRTVRWPVVLIGCLVLPAAVELLQAAALRGVGSTDDFLLNALGICVGWLIGIVAVTLTDRTPLRTDPEQQT